MKGQFYPEFNLRSGLNIFPPRHILQLHHDDGGEQCGVDCGGAQLSPQDRRDPRHAYLGPEGLSPVAALDPEDGQTGLKCHPLLFLIPTNM